MGLRRIREATQRDLPQLRELQTHLDSPSPELLVLATNESPPVAGPLVLLGERVRPGRSIPTGPAISAEPVGFVIAIPGDPAGGASTDENTDAGVYVAELVVVPGYRRNGHGSALLDALATRFPRRNRLRLTTRADDEGTLAFYRANGFRVVDVLASRYEETDGLVLSRETDVPCARE